VGGSCLIYVFLCLFTYNTYCVVFLFRFPSSCVPHVASLSGLYIMINPLVFSDVYIVQISILVYNLQTQIKSDFYCIILFFWRVAKIKNIFLNIANI